MLGDRLAGKTTLVLILLLAGRGAAAQKILGEGVRDLSEQIATGLAKEQKHRIAVLPFRELYGQPTVLGAYLSEEMVTNLVQTSRLDVVERTMLDKILAELKFDQSGLIDPETAKRVGKFAGADAVISGTITDLATYVAVNCRIVDGQTGRIFGAAQVKIVKDADVNKIMETQIPTGSASAVTPAGNLHRDGAEKPAPGSYRQEAGGFLFELRSCRVSGDKADCDFLITSKDGDKELSLYFNTFGRSRSRLIDEAGNESMSDGGSLGARTDRGFVTSVLVEGVPTKARLIFPGIVQTSSLATVLELSCGGFKVQFRNVPLKRD